MIVNYTDHARTSEPFLHGYARVGRGAFGIFFVKLKFSADAGMALLYTSCAVSVGAFAASRPLCRACKVVIGVSISQEVASAFERTRGEDRDERYPEAASRMELLLSAVLAGRRGDSAPFSRALGPFVVPILSRTGRRTHEHKSQNWSGKRAIPLA